MEKLFLIYGLLVYFYVEFIYYDGEYSYHSEVFLENCTYKLLKDQ